ncbi:MAG TPA: efflux RND transporter periplasmic adaptor subunit [Longimicrobiaceae bacterium]|nr:efflux RND transporter periplasmic adaptor subunit [Longimicrobiaceae bacterium]
MTTILSHSMEGPQPRSRYIRIGVLALLALVVLYALARGPLGLLGGTAPAEGAAAAGGGPGAMPPMPVDVAVASRRDVVDALRATGRIEAVQAVDLRPDEQGRITALLFQEGQLVARGTPLVRIDASLLQAQSQRAAADRDLAHQQLARVRRLRAENAAAPADLERAEAAARSAEASLGVLRLQIARSTVRAPFSGVVGQRFVSTGDYVTSATRLLTLQTVDPQRAVLEVPERHALQLRRGQTVEFTVAAQPGRTFRAEVEFIDPVVQSASRTIMVKARAPNRDRLLMPGMFIEARLATETRANAVVVPEDAVQPLRTANVVWAVVDGKASRRVVQLGVRSQGVVEIASGVQDGEQVVVGGLERMAEGMPVAPRPGGAAGTGAPPAPPAAERPAT